MSDTPQDANQQEETFFSHLVELRDRIIKASLAVLIVFLSMVYWAPDIFHLLADPMIKPLPSGSHMIVTDVTGSFFFFF
jgi:sec-independent protein translocase protein TatC